MDLGIIEGLRETVASFSAGMSPEVRLVFMLLFFTAVISIYSLFVFKFYKFLARKNIIHLNLSKYSYSENEGLMKFFAGILYVIEYIVILPIITFFWFAILALFILVLSKSQSLETILIISASLIAAVRVTSYVSEDLSRDLAKMLPFALLALMLVDPDFFSIDLLIGRFQQIPLFLRTIPYYLVFIVALELIMRIVDFISMLFTGFEDSPYHDAFYGEKTEEAVA